MEDKWDIYLNGDAIYVCRSWTGALAFVAQITHADAVLACRQLRFDLEAFTPSMAIMAFDFLIRSHVIGEEVPHPLPPEVFRGDPQTVGLYSFGMYGRRCSFGILAT